MGTDAKVVVRLSIEERLQLEVMLNEPRLARNRGLRIRMLLKADADGPAWPDAKIAEAFDVSVNTVARLRHRCVFEGLEAATARRPPRGTKPRKLGWLISTMRRKRSWWLSLVARLPRKPRNGPCRCWPTSLSS